MIAGTKFRGEFRTASRRWSRRSSIRTARSSVSSTSCIRSSAPAEPRALDHAANLLKPALARGELRCIGATTLNEIQEARREGRGVGASFPDRARRRILVDDTIAILRGLKEKFEIHHGVRNQDSAIIAADVLSHRYIADRFLPE